MHLRGIIYLIILVLLGCNSGQHEQGKRLIPLPGSSSETLMEQSLKMPDCLVPPTINFDTIQHVDSILFYCLECRVLQIGMNPDDFSSNVIHVKNLCPEELIQRSPNLVISQAQKVERIMHYFKQMKHWDTLASTDLDSRFVVVFNYKGGVQKFAIQNSKWIVSDLKRSAIPNRSIVAFLHENLSEVEFESLFPAD